MYRFLKHTGGIIILSIIILFVLDALYSYTFSVSEPRSKIQKLLQLKDVHYDYAFLGSSRTENHIDCEIVGGDKWYDKEKVVGKVFDVTSIPTAFGEENPELLAKFLKVTADMNAKYAKDSEAMMPAISKAAGMDLEGTKAVIGTFVFPSTAFSLKKSKCVLN